MATARALPEPGADCRLVSADYPFVIETPRLRMSLATANDVEPIMRFMDDNAEHGRSVSPMRAERFDEAFARRILGEAPGRFERREEMRFLLRTREDPQGPLVGMRSFTRIRFMADRSCTMSGIIDVGHLRRGYSTEAARGGIAYCFGELGLHRIDAEHRSDHPKVPGVMAKLGFHRIGEAPAYRWADGAWRDYVLYCLINPDAPDGDFTATR